MIKIEHGLKPLIPDPRDFKLGQVITLPKLEDLPDNFILGTPTILDQNADGNEDFCTAYSTSAGCKLQDGVDFYPPYVFAVGKEIAGDDIDSFGLDMRTIFKSWCSVGCIPIISLPEEVKKLTSSQRRDIKNYPENLRILAQEFKKKTYFTISGPYDVYDNIRISLYHYRFKQQVVYLGLLYHWGVQQYILDTTGNFGTGHMVYIIGWDKDGLIVVNSVGKEAGYNGMQRITREVVNYYAPQYGCMMLADISREEVQTILKKKEWLLLSLYEKLLKLLKEYIWAIAR